MAPGNTKDGCRRGIKVEQGGRWESSGSGPSDKVSAEKEETWGSASKEREPLLFSADLGVKGQSLAGVLG